MVSPSAIDVKKMSIDEIGSYKDNPEVGFALASGGIYKEKIDSMDIRSRLTKCLLLIQPIFKAIESKKGEYVEPQLYRALIDLSRSGINANLQIMMGPAPERIVGSKVGYKQDFNGNPDDVHMFTCYHYYLTIGLNGCHRPYEALNCINEAIKSLEKMIKQIKDFLEPSKESPPKFMEMELINYYKLRITLWIELTGVLDTNIRKEVHLQILKQMLGVSDYLRSLNEYDDADSYDRECRLFALKSKIQIPDRIEKGEEKKEVSLEDDMSYEEWCWQNRYWLTPLNEFSTIPRKDWMKDDLEWKTCPNNVIRIKDIIRTYNHCRLALYEYTKSPRMERIHSLNDDSFDRLLDCYLRLYSIIDKSMKLIATDVLHQEQNYEIKFWELGKNPGFKIKQRKCKHLRFLTDLSVDMSVMDFDRKRGFIDPFYIIHHVGLTPGKIRNLMIHSAVEVIDSGQKERVRKNNIITISPMDLEVEVKKLMMQIRELLLGLQLAIKNGAGK